LGEMSVAMVIFFILKQVVYNRVDILK